MKVILTRDVHFSGFCIKRGDVLRLHNDQSGLDSDGLRVLDNSGCSLIVFLRDVEIYETANVR